MRLRLLMWSSCYSLLSQRFLNIYCYLDLVIFLIVVQFMIVVQLQWVVIRLFRISVPCIKVLSFPWISAIFILFATAESKSFWFFFSLFNLTTENNQISKFSYNRIILTSIVSYQVLPVLSCQLIQLLTEFRVSSHVLRVLG